MTPTLLLSLSLAAGQCPGGCAPLYLPILAVGQAAAPRYDWRPAGPGDPGKVHLYHGTQLVGGYDPDADVYRAYDGRAWSAPCGPPLPVPLSYKRPGRDDRGNLPVPAAAGNYGVATEKLAVGERYTVSGRDVNRGEMFAAIASADVPDDSRHYRLSALGGPDAARKAIRQDLDGHPALAGYQGLVAVTDYPSEHWAVKGQGFQARPDAVTLYLQQPDGRVVWRADSYEGPVALASALRRIRPDYNPAADPSPSGPALVPGVPNEWLLIGGALAAAGVFFALTPGGKRR